MLVEYIYIIGGIFVMFGKLKYIKLKKNVVNQ